MFDIGFFELVVIGVVTLLVVGPERLPGLARTAGRWVGRARRMAANLKAEVDREIAAEELKRHLAKQAGIDSVHEIIEQTQQTGAEIDRSLNDTAATAAESLDLSPTATKTTPEAPHSSGDHEPKHPA
ncbi:Sec-independent protein translocase protein TatB [Endothiovibrio diazotrophicus]